ncbi:tRNA threonylcarbamoyladenosine biosynthesis protein TsaE [compost metagenome]
MQAMTESQTLILPNPEATQRLGTLLGRLVQKGDVLLLHGDLGAGKTTLTQGLAQGLDINDRITSPTFALLHEYEGRLPLFHFDLYRLDSPDLSQLGFEEIWEDGHGVVVIEWPERLGEHAPAGHLDVTLTIQEDGRLATLTATGDRPLHLLKELALAW